MLRNFHCESDIINASTIDRYLANNYNSPSSLMMSTSTSKFDSLITSDGRFKIHPNRPHERSLNTIHKEISLHNLMNTHQNCGLLITELINETEIIVNNSLELSSCFPALRFSGYSHRSSLNFQEDINHGHQLAFDLNISTGWSQSHHNNEGFFQPVMKQFSPDETYKIWNTSNVCIAQFIIVHHLDGAYSILPVTAFRHLKFSTEFIAFTPPQPPYAFLGEHLLPVYPSATVVLTPNIPAALSHQANKNEIYLANIGHDAWLDSLDYSVIQGRQVVLIDEGNMHIDYTFRLMEKLRQNFVNVIQVLEYHPIQQIGQVY